jgi:DNA modification methylase
MSDLRIGRHTILIGDVRERLRDLPDESVHMCVTSPPYFGLRSYLPDTVKLRDDITDAEREYVEAELARLGVRPTSGVL